MNQSSSTTENNCRLSFRRSPKSKLYASYPWSRILDDSTARIKPNEEREIQKSHSVQQTWKNHYSAVHEKHQRPIQNSWTSEPFDNCLGKTSNRQPQTGHQDKYGKLRSTETKKWADGCCQHDDMHETIKRQRELIGKLISVIVKDRLKTQDHDSSFRESELYLDAQKLLKFTDKRDAVSPTCRAEEEKSLSKNKRTRTFTGEKKCARKRLRKDRVSPKSATRLNQSSLSETSLAYSSISSKDLGDRENHLSEPTPTRVTTASDEEQEAERDKLLSERALDLMHPDGDSRLFSLRSEFSRQLKSLEDFFKVDDDLIPLQELAPVPKPPVKQEGAIASPTSNKCAGDSEWSPSSMTSSYVTDEDPMSHASSDSCFGKKKISIKEKASKVTQVRVDVSWNSKLSTTDQQIGRSTQMKHQSRRNRKSRRVFSLKKRKSCCVKPVTTRRALDAALQKIKLLRHSDSDDGSVANYDVTKKFEERALEQIRLCKTLWRKLSLELSSFFFSKEMTRHRDLVAENGNLFKGVSNSSHHGNKEGADSGVTEDPLAKLPDNAADPSFIIAKFLGLNEETLKLNFQDDGATKDEMPDASRVQQENNEVVSSFNYEDEEKSASDIFEFGGFRTSRKSSFRSSVLQLNFDDPDVIGEVVVVTTDDHVTVPQDGDSPKQPINVKAEEGVTSKIVDSGNVPPDQIHVMVSRPIKVEPDEVASDDKQADLQSRQKSKAISGFPNEKPQPLMQRFRPLHPKDVKSVTKAKKKASRHSVPYPSASLAPDNQCSAGRESVSETRKNEDAPSDVEEPTVETLSNEKKALSSSEEANKSLARPLKKLISDATLDGDCQCKADVVEWGLVPRKAMGLAKQRIQEQLCGDKNIFVSDVTLSRTTRKLSLRSHSQLPSSDSNKQLDDEQQDSHAGKPSSCRVEHQQSLDVSPDSGNRIAILSDSSFDDDLPVIQSRRKVRQR